MTKVTTERRVLLDRRALPVQLVRLVLEAKKVPKVPRAETDLAVSPALLDLLAKRVTWESTVKLVFAVNEELKVTLVLLVPQVSLARTVSVVLLEKTVDLANVVDEASRDREVVEEKSASLARRVPPAKKVHPVFLERRVQLVPLENKASTARKDLLVFPERMATLDIPVSVENKVSKERSANKVHRV